MDNAESASTETTKQILTQASENRPPNWPSKKPGRKSGRDRDNNPPQQIKSNTKSDKIESN